jgi:uncharacterized protein YeaO (DUF488 family)
MSGSGSKLLALSRHLSAQWQQTKEYWQDAKSHEFERKYIDELMASVDKAVTVMEQVDKLVGKIRSDCE